MIVEGLLDENEFELTSNTSEIRDLYFKSLHLSEGYVYGPHCPSYHYAKFLEKHPEFFD